LLVLQGQTGILPAASISPDGNNLVIASGKVAHIREAKTGGVRFALHGHTDTIYSATFSPNGKRILTRQDNNIRVWDFESGKELSSMEGEYDAKFSPDSSRVLIRTDKARVRDAETGRELAELKTDYSLGSPSFSPNGRRIVAISGGTDNSIRVYDTETGAEMIVLTERNGNRSSVSFSPDGRRILSRSSMNRLLIYDSAPVNRAFLRLPLAPLPRRVQR